ncbi:hypothetical protein QTH97_18620 [Variovorax sp. J22R24]|uniref:hypothetical protein n=1 Tax=Variovorax gracilis TaxID=3053502 RepID=UPI0025769D98|nr:hypothetical protein [Variovorax sp. J22R24]MDM0106967.1 hypothetical protein [Variovorax sp. J22R24]
MSTASPLPIAYGFFQPLLDWQSALAESWLQAQDLQLQMLSTWHHPFTAVHQELWDLWVAHFGGGVPLDA